MQLFDDMGWRERQTEFSTWNLQDDDKKKLESYYTGFESYCKPRSNQIYARYKLRCREQEDSEILNTLLLA